MAHLRKCVEGPLLGFEGTVGCFVTSSSFAGLSHTTTLAILYEESTFFVYCY